MPGPRGGGAELDRFAAEALADHVELVEAGIVEGDGAALPLVRHLNLEPEHVAKLPLERGQVRVDRRGVSGAGPPAIRATARAALLAPRALLGLADRETLRDDLASQSFGIGSRRHSPRVPHRDITSQ